MRTPSAKELLASWESSGTCPHSERALNLLAVAFPDAPFQQLAALSIGLRDGLLLRLRQYTFGSRMACRTNCPECSQALELDLDSSELHPSLPQELEPPQEYTFTQAEYQLRFRLPCSDDLMLMDQASETVDASQWIFDRCVLEAVSHNARVTAERLPASVIEAVTRRMEEMDPSADIRLALTCPDCQSRWSETFDIVEFFWKELDCWARRLLREIHVLASAYHWREDEILSMSPWRRQAYLGMVGR